MKHNEKKILVTHSGSFHADDVFAYAVLMELFSEHELIRSRNKEDWEKGDIVFDVGGGEFDHHSVDKIYRDNGIPYASFGLIWREYGKEYLKKWHENEEVIIEAHRMIDSSFVQAIDAFDNGVDLIKNSPIRVNTISDVIASFNNLVDSFSDKTPEKVSLNQDIFFIQATKVAKQLLENEVVGVLNLFRSKESVEEAFKNRKDKALVILEENCPWEDTIWELDSKEEVLFVVYPKPEGHYIQVMRKDRTTFDARKDLPIEWAGKRDEELGNIIGIKDAIFCHPARFLAGANSKESILKMADLALKN